MLTGRIRKVSYWERIQQWNSSLSEVVFSKKKVDPLQNKNQEIFSWNYNSIKVKCNFINVLTSLWRTLRLRGIGETGDGMCQFPFASHCLEWKKARLDNKTHCCCCRPVFVSELSPWNSYITLAWLGLSRLLLL